MSKQALPEEIDKMLLMNTIERPSMLSPRLDSLGQPLDELNELPKTSIEDYFCSLKLPSDFSEWIQQKNKETEQTKGHSKVTIEKPSFFDITEFEKHSIYVHKFRQMWKSNESNTMRLLQADSKKRKQEELKKQEEERKKKKLENQKDEKKEEKKPPIPVHSSNSVKPVVEQSQPVIEKRVTPSPAHENNRRKTPTTSYHSSLTRAEHQEYLQLRKEYLTVNPQTGVSRISPSQSARFFLLRTRVQNEQREYKQAMMEEAMQEKERFQVIHPTVSEKLEAILAAKRKRIFTYPQFYKNVKMVSLVDIKAARDDPILTAPETVLQLGKVYTFEPHVFNIPGGGIKLPLNRSIHECLPTQPNEPLHWIKRTTPVVSADSAVQWLLQKHKIDVVLSSSTLLSLLDNHSPHYNEEWCIPVIITQTSINPKVIILDKPLLKRKLTIREKNNMYYKLAFESYGLNVKPETPVIDFNKDNQLAEQFKDLVAQCDNLCYNIWTLGNTRILIRCKIHGVMPDPTDKLGYKFVGMKAKTEFQHPKGLEEITINEYARWWGSAYIRKDLRMYIGRFNAQDGSVLTVEQRDIKTMLPHGCPFKPAQSIKILYVLLETLKKMEMGNYLLSHGFGQNQVAILRNVDKPLSDYDLHLDYKNAGTTDMITIPYVPLVWAGAPDQIPYTFPIEPDTKNGGSSKDKKKKRKRKRKKKGTKKQQADGTAQDVKMIADSIL